MIRDRNLGERIVTAKVNMAASLTEETEAAALEGFYAGVTGDLRKFRHLRQSAGSAILHLANLREAQASHPLPGW